MKWVETSTVVALGLVIGADFDFNLNAVMAMDTPDSAIAVEEDTSGLSRSTVVDLNALTTNPADYDFFTFRPNLEKLILAGAADTEHISILWYTVPDGSVGLHYHSMTESVYAIAGTQTDEKGVYPTGSLYFNPPGSGHAISDSTGFFILAYASPPDFASTDLIEDYTPVQINTAEPDFTLTYPFESKQDGISVYTVPLDPQGGMSSEFIQTTTADVYEYTGNYLLVLKGSCTIDGAPFGEDMLVVATTVETQTYQIKGSEDTACLVLGLSF